MSCPICYGEPVYRVFSTYKTKYVMVPSQYNQCSACCAQWHSSLRTDLELRQTIEKLEKMVDLLIEALEACETVTIDYPDCSELALHGIVTSTRKKLKDLK